MTRTYLPADYLDETVPDTRASPSDWIVAMPGDVYGLAAIEDEAPHVILEPGDEVLFCWKENYGFLTVTILDDGSYTTDREADPRANCVWEKGDPDTLDGDVASFVENRSENGGGPGDVEIEHYFWSERERYRFEHTSIGPRFVKVEV